MDWASSAFFRGTSLGENHKLSGKHIPVKHHPHATNYSICSLFPELNLALMESTKADIWGGLQMDKRQWDLVAYETLLLLSKKLKGDDLAKLKKVAKLARINLQVSTHLHSVISELTLPSGESPIHPLDLRYRAIQLLASWRATKSEELHKWVIRQVSVLKGAIELRIVFLKKVESASDNDQYILKYLGECRSILEQVSKLLDSWGTTGLLLQLPSGKEACTPENAIQHLIRRMHQIHGLTEADSSKLSGESQPINIVSPDFFQKSDVVSEEVLYRLSTWRYEPPVTLIILSSLWRINFDMEEEVLLHQTFEECVTIFLCFLEPAMVPLSMSTRSILLLSAIFHSYLNHESHKEKTKEHQPLLLLEDGDEWWWYREIGQEINSKAPNKLQPLWVNCFWTILHHFPKLAQFDDAQVSMDYEFLLSKYVRKASENRIEEPLRTCLLTRNSFELTCRKIMSGELRDTLVSILCDYQTFLDGKTLPAFVQLWTTLQISVTQRDVPGIRLKNPFTGEFLNDHRRWNPEMDKIPESEQKFMRNMFRHFILCASKNLVNRVFGLTIKSLVRQMQELELEKKKPNNKAQSDPQLFGMLINKNFDNLANATQNLTEELSHEVSTYGVSWNQMLFGSCEHAVIVYTVIREQLFFLLTLIPKSQLWPDPTATPPGCGRVLLALQILQIKAEALGCESPRCVERLFKSSPAFKKSIARQQTLANRAMGTETPVFSGYDLPSLLTPLATKAALALRVRFRELDEDIFKKFDFKSRVWKPQKPPRILHSAEIVDVWTFVFQSMDAIVGMQIPFSIGLEHLLDLSLRWIQRYCQGCVDYCIVPGKCDFHEDPGLTCSEIFPMLLKVKEVSYLVGKRPFGARVDAETQRVNAVLRKQHLEEKEKKRGQSKDFYKNTMLPDIMFAEKLRPTPFLEKYEMPEYVVRLWDLQFSLRQIEAFQNSIEEKLVEEFGGAENTNSRRKDMLSEYLRARIQKFRSEIITTGELLAKFMAARMVFFDIQTDLFFNLYSPKLLKSPLLDLCSTIKNAGMIDFLKQTPVSFYPLLASDICTNLGRVWIFIVLNCLASSTNFGEAEYKVLELDELALRKLTLKFFDDISSEIVEDKSQKQHLTQVNDSLNRGKALIQSFKNGSITEVQKYAEDILVRCLNQSAS